MTSHKSDDRTQLEGHDEGWSLEEKLARLRELAPNRLKGLEVLVDIALKDEWRTPAKFAKRQRDTRGL